KPKDVITTVSDEKGRRTVIDLLRNKVPERVFPVGRLDRMTTGLLLLTNDGDLAQRLSHPSFKVKKIYYVVLDKILPEPDLERIRKGVELEDGIATVDGIDYVGQKKNEIGIELHLGKNRIIRRIFEHLGYEVVKLDRTFYAGLTKKDLPRGHFRHLKEKEIIMLKHFTKGKKK
ncbi:MAG: pseudouridine synthase, partial [Bacteroidetes bacterium]